MLPPLYASWMKEFLPGPLPEETRASCHDCAMLPREGAVAAVELTFHPATKCCTYLPRLPNFLVGRILGDEDPTAKRGRETVRQRVRAGDGVSPLGLDVQRRYGLLYRHSDGFGRTPSMRCPHFLEAEGGLCGVWNHRNSICSTWFCKHVRGAAGAVFWKALEQLLSHIETELAWWAALQVAPGTEALRQLLETAAQRVTPAPLSAVEMEGSASSVYARAWGSWLGREEECYRECARLVEALSWSAVLSACGPAISARALVAREAYTGLVSPALPPRLRMGPFRVRGNDGEHAVLDCYSEFDPLSVSRTLQRLLPHFDGRPTTTVLEELRVEHGVRLSPELLQKLVDFQVLVACDD